MSAKLAVAAAPSCLDASGLEQLFLDARTHNRWLTQPVDPTSTRR